MGTIPKDEATKKKIVDIIDHQFDLEIYLKQREVATIRNEIAKAESALHDLKLAVENESMAASMPEASHYTRRSAMYYNGGSQALFSHQANGQIVPRRKTYRTAEKSKLFGRRNDGVFVSLACPVCHRDDLLNLQGFLNHCRISHNLEFGPYEQVMLQCGTPVDESEVPMDNPARLRQVMNLTPSASKQSQQKLERPSIKVFEEDVDMELENERRSSLRESEGKVTENEDVRTSNEQTQPASMTSNTVKIEDEQSTEKATEVVEAPQKADRIKPSSETVEATSSESSSMKENEDQPHISPDTKNEEPENPEETTKIESFAAAMSSVNAGDIGSRFYIKQRILVGNVSKYIPPERRDPALKQFTHKWMIYVVEPPQAKQQVGAFITCVRFHLHPSYKPNDVVDVTEPPFKLTRFGWGEFPVRIQLFFVDKRRNKAVDLIHHLKLDNYHTGKQLLGGERSIEIELDRNTDFKDTSSPAPASSVGTPAALTAHTPTTSSSTLNDSSAVQLIPEHAEQQQKKEAETLTSMAVKQRLSLLNGILNESVRRLPIVRAGSHGTVLPYSCAASSKMFFEWSVGKRKALEWHRARLLRLEAQKRAHEANDNVLHLAAEALSTKDVVLWCRNNKYTPTKNATIEDARESDLPPGYCKFCGSLRDGHDETIDDHCPRRPKGWNSSRKKGGINSTTSVSKLLNTFEPGWDQVLDSNDDLDIDVDMDDGPAPERKQVNHRQAILERVRNCVLDADNMDVANERSLDWIWSVVGQLRLKSVIANDMLFGKDGNLQGPTSSFDLESAMEQRLVVGNILTQATRVFLKNLISHTVNICHKEEEGSADKSTKMMVPYHIYQATQQREEFDFLTNQYMGPEEVDSSTTPSAKDC
ncbi:hypothetical protein [Parasitella parasitica]|uniref:YEATS domain-containing protein n=1 Tax=Parasitella parasitica TaxID=35722 RepID=A0A0B7N8Y7_9FUNG|nr:hypothetical protein [Parasitella parasitica]